jgi:hypothetical protein
MGEPADAVDPVRQLARLLLGERDQIRKGFHSKPRRRSDQHRRAAEISNRCDIAGNLNRQIFRASGKCDERRQRHHAKRITVGSGGCGGARGDGAARARLIDHDGLLAPDSAQAFGNEAHRNVDGTSGR